MNKKDRMDRIEYFLDIDTLDGWPTRRIGHKTHQIVDNEVYKNNKYFKECFDEVRVQLKALVEYLGIEYVPPKTKEIPGKYKKTATKNKAYKDKE